MNANTDSNDSRHQRRNKLKHGENVESKTGPVHELYDYCEKHRCDPPNYISEHNRLTLVLSGSYIFSKIPEFRPKNKVRNNNEAKIDLAKQALRWIQNNPPPSFDWKNPRTEDLLTDFIAELAEGVYESGSNPKEVKDFLIYLEAKAMSKLFDRLENRGVPKSSIGTPEYRRALDEPPRRTATNTVNTTLAEEKLPPLTVVEKVWLHVGKICDRAAIEDLDDELRMLTAIISQDGIRFLRQLQLLSDGHGKNRLQFLQYVLDSFSGGLIQDISKGYLHGERSWSEKNVRHFAELKQRGLLGVFNSVALSLGYDAEKHSNLFLRRHQNGMFQTVTNLSTRVGPKTQHYLEKLLQLEDAGLFALMDEVTTLSEGRPTRLLDSYMYRKRDETSQRLLKLEEKSPGRSSQVLEEALRYNQLNIFREINTLIGASGDSRGVTNFFRILARSKESGALGYLCEIDGIAPLVGDLSRFLEVSLQLYRCGVHTWAVNNSLLIGYDLMFFRRMFFAFAAAEYGQASPAVAEAIALVNRLESVVAAHDAMNNTAQVNQTSIVATAASDMHRKPLPTLPKPASKAKSQLIPPGSQPPTSTGNISSSATNGGKSNGKPSKPMPSQSVWNAESSKGKCFLCPRESVTMQKGRLYCEECKKLQ
ncbi:hypothetical protein EAF04_009782 [Stromatinia cepivora]|nr:hypothetical protein EAF04_009782 [Stromatinia cepivora]